MGISLTKTISHELEVVNKPSDRKSPFSGVIPLI